MDGSFTFPASRLLEVSLVSSSSSSALSSSSVVNWNLAFADFLVRLVFVVSRKLPFNVSGAEVFFESSLLSIVAKDTTLLAADTGFDTTGEVGIDSVSFLATLVCNGVIACSELNALFKVLTNFFC